MATRYVSHFATSMDDAYEVGGWRNLEDAKALCERQASMDIFGMPRVYVEEKTEYPEDDLHEAATSWERTEFHEYDGGEWAVHPIQ